MMAHEHFPKLAEQQAALHSCLSGSIAGKNEE
jgi:hypothetical protein